MSRWFVIVSVGVAAMAAAPGVARATLEVPAGDPAFSAAIAQCREEFAAIGGEAKEIFDHLAAPNDATHRHRTRLRRPGAPGHFQNSMLPDDGAAASPDGAGNPGAGSDSTVTWDPTDDAPYDAPPDLGVARSPCVSLLHELKHAYDADRGVLDRRVRTRGPTPADEPLREWDVDACRTENKYRTERGAVFPPPLGQRRGWGPDGLPADTQF